MSGRVFIGPPGMPIIGRGSDGVPVMADETGVEPMVEIGTIASPVHFTYDNEDD